jgi:hypothetical protein
MECGAAWVTSDGRGAEMIVLWNECGLCSIATCVRW